MHDVLLTHEALASVGLDLTRYNELVGEIYDGALEPKRMAHALRSVIHHHRHHHHHHSCLPKMPVQVL